MEAQLARRRGREHRRLRMYRLARVPRPATAANGRRAQSQAPAAARRGRPCLLTQTMTAGGASAAASTGGLNR